MATFQLGRNLVSNPIIILIFNDTKGKRSCANDTHPSCNTPDSNVIMTAPYSVMKYSHDGAGCKIWPENCYSTPSGNFHLFYISQISSMWILAREGQGVTFSCLGHWKQKEITKTLCLNHFKVQANYLFVNISIHLVLIGVPAANK